MKKLILLVALGVALNANEYHYMNMMSESCYENRKALSMALSAKGDCNVFGITQYNNSLNGLIEQLNINYERFCK